MERLSEKRSKPITTTVDATQLGPKRVLLVTTVFLDGEEKDTFKNVSTSSVVVVGVDVLVDENTKAVSLA